MLKSKCKMQNEKVKMKNAKSFADGPIKKGPRGNSWVLGGGCRVEGIACRVLGGDRQGKRKGKKNGEL